MKWSGKCTWKMTIKTGESEGRPFYLFNLETGESESRCFFPVLFRDCPPNGLNGSSDSSQLASTWLFVSTIQKINFIFNFFHVILKIKNVELCYVWSNHWFCVQLIIGARVMGFKAYFSYIVVVSFIGGGNRIIGKIMSLSHWLPICSCCQNNFTLFLAKRKTILRIWYQDIFPQQSINSFFVKVFL
jgi:hypothetical protein